MNIEISGHKNKYEYHKMYYDKVIKVKRELNKLKK